MTILGHIFFLLILISSITAPVRTDCSVTSKPGNCTTIPKKISSKWFDTEAQSAVESRVAFVSEMEEGCNELPLKVEVQIKSSSQGGFIFPGSGITQRLNKKGSPYGGVVYKYKEDGSIRIMAPKGTVPSGVSLFSGGSTWDGVTHVNESRSQVRYRAWCRCNLPAPGFESQWTDINVSDKSYLEINHGLGVTPDMVIVQLRHGSTTRDWVTDVTGSMSTSGPGSRKDGVIYGYDSQTIRIWAPNNGALFNTTDGWGLQKDHEVLTSGQVKVYAWGYLMNIEFKTFSINKTTPRSQLEVNLPDTINVDQDIVYFTISPTDGDNRGFSFPGLSSVQIADSAVQYGGVMYSYSTGKIRLWHPTLDSQHFLVYINHEWGKGKHAQSSESVVAKVSVWKSGKICLIPANKRTTPKLTTTQSTTKTTIVTTTKAAVPQSAAGPNTNQPKGPGNTSARQQNKKEAWYDGSLQVPVIWLVVGGGVFLLILLVVCTVCLCQKNSTDSDRRRVFPQESDF